MDRRDFSKLVGTGSLLLPSLTATATQSPSTQPKYVPDYSSTSPFPVGDKAQLFIDRVLVRESEQVAFTLHPAERHANNPIVKADKPWEGWRLEIYGNVIYDEEEKIFKMWYIGEAPNYFSPSPDGPSSDNATLYATSQDGAHWEKPLVGTAQALNGSKHNAVVNAAHLASVIKDNRERDPVKRYKMLCYVDQPKALRGYQTMISPDGLNWKAHSTKVICPGADVITGYYDEGRRLYVALAKINTPFRGHNRRVFYLTTSRDFENWTEPELVWTPDLEDDAGSLRRIEEVRSMLDVPDNPALMRTEFYGFGFYVAESCTLGFPWMFTINNNARYGNHEGPGELQMGVTRDLIHWERPFRTPIVPRGKPGEWDSGFFVTQSRALRVKDEVWLYYGSSNYTHGTPCLYRAQGTGRGTKYTGAIGLAKWKLDRFVSADGPVQGGSLTTIPVLFVGDHLEINALTRTGGSIAVEVLDASGRPLDGFGPSDAFSGDDLRKPLTWKGNPSVQRLAGKPISLKFNLKNAELYSFAFRQKV